MGMVKTDVRTQGHRLRRPGLRQVLVITQLAISIVVVVSSGLFLRSLKTQQATDPGFRAENLVSTLVNPGMFVEDQAKIRGFFQELTARLEALPGAGAVSSSLYMPLINVQSRCGPIIRDGDPTPPPNQQRPVWYSVIAAHYFQTMETPLLFGRDFTEGDRQSGGAAIIINSHLARALFGREDAAVGKRVRIGTVAATPLEIVGVARDGRYFSLLEDPLPWIYFPVIRPELHEVNWSMRTFLVRARSARDVPAVVAGVRREVAALDPRIPLSELFASQAHLDFTLLLPRIAVGLSLMLALLALALATMGIYSVMTYTVSQRTREIGIRMALGGRVRDIVALVLAQGLGLSLVGVVVGVLGAWGLTRLLGSLLYGVSASDPATFALTVALLVAVALVATLLPARRAARVDPMVALRQD
jgi:predicted permease